MRGILRVGCQISCLMIIVILLTPSATAEPNDTSSGADLISPGIIWSYVCWDDNCNSAAGGIDHYDYFKFYVYYGDEVYVKIENTCNHDYVNVYAKIYRYSSTGWESDRRIGSGGYTSCGSPTWISYTWTHIDNNDYRKLKITGIDDGYSATFNGDDQAEVKITLTIDDSNRDRDYDGYDDDDDDCKYEDGDSYQDRDGCPDYDGDGWSDYGDDCPYDSSEHLDSDGDGFCDGDDAFPSDDTQWEDYDGDGHGDNPDGNQGDHFPTDNTQWYDTDGDDWGDNSDGNNPDHCRFVYGGSSVDRNGCPDSDWDGYSDPDSTFPAHPIGIADAFKYDWTEWHDTDGDDYGDNSDQCLEVEGTSAFKVFYRTLNGTSEVGPLAIEVVSWDHYGGDAKDLTDIIYSQMTLEELEEATEILEHLNYDYTPRNDNPYPLGAGSNYYFQHYPGCIDSDGDGFEDDTDHFPQDSTQWVDSDGDGFGDNAMHPTIGDSSNVYDPSICMNELRTAINDGAFPASQKGMDVLLCAAWGAENDFIDVLDEDYVCDNGNTVPQYWVNDEWDDCGDNSDEGVDDWDTSFSPSSRYFHHQDYDIGWAIPGAFQSDACPLDEGTSTIDRFGCLDTDGDGYSDADANWTIEDGADVWPFDSSQHSDTDGDGHGDNSAGTQGDSCPFGDSTQSSTIDRWGCTDTDGDGYSDADGGWLAHPDGSADAFPNDDTQWHDADGDGHGDNADGTDYDHFTIDPTQWEDEDGDGLNKSESTSHCGDDLSGNNPDLYPNDPTQCKDTDGDGFGDNPEGTTMPDLFPLDATQWSDIDGDGYGDNGIGNNSDSCISNYGTSTMDRYGCPDSDSDGYSDMNGFFSTVTDKAGNGDIGSILILAIVPFLAIIIITVLQISKKKKNNDGLNRDDIHEAMQDAVAWGLDEAAYQSTATTSEPEPRAQIPPPSNERALPPNSNQGDSGEWIEQYDQQGNMYYFNPETQESKWEL